MTQIRHDPRIRKTRAAIRGAFIRLMQQKDYDAITVTDISEDAQINRKTFYAHYETKEQLISQIMEEMFTDMFGAFMYEKPEMTEETGGEALIGDAIRFFESVQAYREELETLIVGKTVYISFEIADRVIRNGLSSIRVEKDEADVLVPEALIVNRIKNFFFTGIDWWLEQTQYSTEQAAQIYCRLMQRSAASIFRYENK